MGDFIYIPVAALFCYAFLLLALIAAKKNKMINSFIVIICVMILWTGGSMLMRMQLWPSIKFWYDVSILGLTLMPFAFFKFINDFVGLKGVFLKYIYLAFIITINIINITTGLLLAHPEAVVSANGQTTFIYHPSWPVYIMFGVCGFIVLHILYLIINQSKTNEAIRKQLTPIAIGVTVLFLGNIIIMFPYFKGFPADILAGVINAFFLLYALYKRRLFKLTLLISRGNCYAIAIALSIIIFANVIQPLERFIYKELVQFADHTVLFIAVCFSLAILAIYWVIKKFFDNAFIKEEILQAENLKKFSLKVSRSLQVDEILDELVEIIKMTIGVKHVYVCVCETEGSCYSIEGSTSALDEKTFTLKKDNPIIAWLSENNECLLMKDFRKTVSYKSMWDEEKKSILDLGIECFIPLIDEEQLIGVILLSSKERNVTFNFDDINFLESVSSVGSIALKNSKLYEKAYYEARTDELTGLLNRKYFYEIIQNEYDKMRNSSLSLIILNIDDFKLYNQLYGNKEGDIALQNVAQIIESCVGSNGYVARYSGKAFAIILPSYDILSAKNLAENIRKQILYMNKKGTKDYTLKALTVSGGICSIPYAASNVKQLIDYADMSVYNAKRTGKNNICVYAVDKKMGSMESSGEIKKVDIYSEYASTIYALTAAIDAKDHYTFNHSKSVASYAAKLAVAYGMSEEHVKIVKEAALLHDIGKIGIPEHILNKHGKLTEEEYEIIKGHVENSIGIIRHLPSLDYVIPAVIGHHERYDGHGYPRRIAGEDIPVSARILCIADSFDAMISKRTYKKPYTVAYALEILEEQAGLQFDPKLVRIFTNLVRDGLIRINEEES